jgi:tRNA threonylcarbamoyladenosine biosynthesis protein TsaE
MHQQWNVRSADEMKQVASEILATFQNHSSLILCLSGDLGAGKTTFTQAFGELLGVTEPITSPTFTIMRGYETQHPVLKKLIHIDAYRIEDESEISPLQFQEVFLGSEQIVCIEWPERIASVIPDSAVHLTFEMLPDESRQVTIVSE